jgi:hypothetical protein
MQRGTAWPPESTERIEPLAALAPTQGAAEPAKISRLDPPRVDPGLARDTASASGSSSAMLDPAAELATAESALAAGDRVGAAIRLAVVLRFAPALAPAVLDIAAAEPGPAWDLVRGDALRLVGHETGARRAYASAAAALTTHVDPHADTEAGRTTVDPTP